MFKNIKDKKITDKKLISSLFKKISESDYEFDNSPQRHITFDQATNSISILPQPNQGDIINIIFDNLSYTFTFNPNEMLPSEVIITFDRDSVRFPEGDWDSVAEIGDRIIGRILRMESNKISVLCIGGYSGNFQENIKLHLHDDVSIEFDAEVERIPESVVEGDIIILKLRESLAQEVGQHLFDYYRMLMFSVNEKIENINLLEEIV